jgi:hypothetical protein
VTSADVTGRKGALEMLGKNAPKLAKALKVLCDGGYTGERFARAVAALFNADVETDKRNEQHKFTVRFYCGDAK